METNVCDECNSRLVGNSGRLVCQNCGLVCDVILESNSYSLGAENKGDTRRTQHFTAVNDQFSSVTALGSSIGLVSEYIFSDNSGNKINEQKQEKFRKFKRYYHITGALHGKETDHRTLKILEKVCVRHQIVQEIRHRTIYLYKKYKEQHKGTITNHVLLSAVCLLIAIRESQQNCPITLKEIVSTYREMGHNVMGKSLLSLMQDLNLKLSAKKIRRSEEYIARICSQVATESEIKERVKKKYSMDAYVFEKTLELICYRLLEKIPYSDRGGKRPFPFAAASVYVADKVFSKKMGISSALTQKIVAKAVNVAEFTIRDHAEFIFQYNCQDIVEDICKRLSTSFE